MLKLVIILFLLLIPLSIVNSQYIKLAGTPVAGDEVSVPKSEKHDKTALYKKSGNLFELKSDEAEYRNFIQQVKSPGRVEQLPEFDIVSSFKKNIRWGGFHDGYAVVNFTPDMYIKPFSFISIYASHSYSKYVPVETIKYNYKAIVLEGLALLAVDNSVNFLFSFNNMVRSIAGFTVKNIVAGIIRNNTKTRNGIQEYKHYFYSVNIRF